ncbi:hypothetical protein GP486_000808 [Trichoglossum hirsutum]|uniref:Uncharacterized protein n=1 Tax=Trichoglossum hirsutum TaxID=265104 RepID=A0A9P8LIB8_9PEZI|nr:hypothetical protein GP486_000808 [Trichoglossum hirsutum]
MTKRRLVATKNDKSATCWRHMLVLADAFLRTRRRLVADVHHIGPAQLLRKVDRGDSIGAPECKERKILEKEGGHGHFGQGKLKRIYELELEFKE